MMRRKTTRRTKLFLSRHLQAARPVPGLRVVAVGAVLLVSGLAIGCGANDQILKSGKDDQPRSNTAAPSNAASDVQDMRTADFSYIFVLRRKDGGVMDADDRAFIRVQTDGAPRRVSSEDEHAYVIGSNAAIPPNRMTALYQRFNVEDDSPAGPAPANVANTNKRH